MRIRNSKVLFPSSLSTVPLSDPNLISRSPVVVQLNDAIAMANTTHHASADSQAASSLDRYQPSDQTLPPIRKPSNGCDDDDPSGIGESGAYRQHNKQELLEEEDCRRHESAVLREKSNSHYRKGCSLGLEIGAHQVMLPSSPSSTQDGRWCEGEKGIPLKKRRGGFENDGGDGNSKKMKAPKMKTKMNKKCSTIQNDNDNDKDWEEEEEKRRETKADHHHHVNNNNNNNVGKKRAKGSAVMEGSRCSRVNGRGWRCCQQTLVGYSLCEHHLGKGRLRSMTSVRNRSSITSSSTTADKKKKKKKVHDDEDGLLSEPLGASSFPEKRTTCVSDDDPLVNDEKKEVIVRKRRMKLGMVKARSISSLLGQTNTAVTHEDNN
ncbi:hypothetical protein RIF29_25158 [Crotalaria pallida]|uniref:WRC domain-containing protein n=1 Tax=Crotalaria pallida TaxID=3830 RepID=A0AAN9ELW9_CROPI